MHDVSEDLPWNESKENKTEIMNGIFVEFQDEAEDLPMRLVTSVYLIVT